MTDRPMIFAPDMARALWEGRKTQTRRILKPQPDLNLPIGGAEFVQMDGQAGRWCWLNGWDGSIVAPFSVPYAPGDRLWVREALDIWYDADAPIGMATYASDGSPVDLTPEGAAHWVSVQKRNRIPPIHMPKWASRMTPHVTDVLVQRVQEISEGDARAEGIIDGGCLNCGNSSLHEQCCPDPAPSFVDSFAFLWNSIHGPDAWDRNDWVAALTFTVERKNISEARR